VNQDATDSSSHGLFRVVLWGFLYALFGALALANELEKGQPDWWVLAGLSSLLIAACFSELRNLANVKAGTSSERRTTICAILGGALVAAFILGTAYFYSSAFALHLTGLYVIPATAVLVAIFAFLAWRVERKARVRVFFGNKGWVFLASKPPSNSTLERDARESSARPSA